MTTGYQRLRFGIAMIVVAICYSGVVPTLLDELAGSYRYQYGLAVPLIAAYVVWLRWPILRNLHGSPDYMLGGPTALLAAAMLGIGHLAGLNALLQLSLIPTLAAVVLLLWGSEAFRLTRFPLFYLLLMLPIWDYPIDRVSAASQEFSAWIASGLLGMVGIPSLRQDTLIVLPRLTLKVLPECSGVNQLIAIVALTLPAATVWLTTRSRRLAMMVAAVVIAYLSNGVRIASVGWIGHYGMAERFSAGPLHLMQGLVISALGYVLIGICLSVLSRTERRTDSSAHQAASVSAEPRSVVHSKRHSLVDLAVVTALLVAVSYPVFLRPSDVGLTSELRSLPDRIDEWQADTSTSLVHRPEASTADDEITRTYRSTGGHRVQLHVAYLRHQLGERELVDPAIGMSGAEESAVTLRNGSQEIELDERVREDANGSSGIVFWYDLDGRIAPNRYAAKRYTIWNALTRWRTNGAVVVISWQSPAGAPADGARGRAIAFAQSLMPVLRRHFPS